MSELKSSIKISRNLVSMGRSWTLLFLYLSPEDDSFRTKFAKSEFVNCREYNYDDRT